MCDVDVDRLYDEWDAACNRVRELEAQAIERQQKLIEATEALEINKKIIAELNARITELEAQ